MESKRGPAELKVDLEPLSVADALNALRLYPELELYRLVVDGALHKDEMGWIEYENREPGSLNAAFNGLSLAIQSLLERENQITSEFIRSLHNQCTTNVFKKRNKIISGKTRADFFPIKQCHFGLTEKNASQQGIFELLCFMQKYAKQGMKFSDFYGIHMIVEVPTEHDFPTGTLRFQGLRAEKNNGSQLEASELQQLSQEIYEKIISGTKYIYFPPNDTNNEILDSLVESYNQQIIEASTSEEKLRVILYHISAFNRLHPFNDGNIRTFVIALLAHLLLKNGYPPPVFYDPNQFDAYSIDELISETITSIQRTNELASQKLNMLFGFDSEDIPSEYHEKWNNIIDNFLETLETVYQAYVPKTTVPIAPLSCHSVFHEPDNSRNSQTDDAQLDPTTATQKPSKPNKNG